MINIEFPFHVKVEVSDLVHFKFEMKFYYGTDLRFNQHVHSVDNSAIECWINCKPYTNNLNGIKF